MRILVWGFGNYYRQKEKSIPQADIIAYVSGKVAGTYKGIKIIDPTAVFQYDFDKLYIMAGLKTAFEILDELIDLGYQEWNKVVLGWSIEPYTEEETALLEDGKIQCNSQGSCIYISSDQETEIKCEKDWERLKQRKVREKQKNEMSGIGLEPISNIFGIDRGLPIDRYYIEKFLDENSIYIKGTVLEVGEREYTMRYGTDVRKSICMHVCDQSEDNSIIANLETGEGVVEGLTDCFILTQTLPFIFDVKTAAENTVRFLKSGGTALVTVAGISQISRYDMDRWGHYWSFTTASLKKLFEICRDVETVEVKAYGNVKTSVSALYGLAVEDMDTDDLAYRDDDYQQIITAVVKKR